MILGILDRRRPGRELKEELLAVQQALSVTNTQANVWGNQCLAICWTSSEPISAQPSNPPDLPVVMFQGKIHNRADIIRRLGIDDENQRSGELLARLYQKYGETFVEEVNGNFAFALWNESNEMLILGRDRLGIQPLFYVDDGQRFIFSSSLRTLAVTKGVGKELNSSVVLQYLLYCHNPSDATFLHNAYKVPAGHLLVRNGSHVSLKRYWRLSFAEPRVKTERQYCEEIVDLIEDTIRIRLEPDRPVGVFLSGGTDSSAIVSLTSRMLDQPIHTFSFRCEGRSYDESPYARSVAQRYGTRHTEVPYGADHLSMIAEAVKGMEEPFCDIGIEIGTYLLGQAAKENVSYVLSGEGGDELFGGHPVYVADKVAAVVDRLPRALINPLVQLFQKIPDTDQKKNLQVKLKRFAYSLSFPPKLLSHRWRIYYTPQELHELCTEEFFDPRDMERLFAVVFRHTEWADGPDQLSHSLYVDYQTLVDFYLRRLGLLRTFSLESYLPLLDHRLVEYAAKIPSHLKIRRFSDTKYIYKKALETLLPREILYDRPKLGHSVPMKNWLRDDATVRDWVTEVLLDECFKRTGFFRTHVIQRLLREHTEKSHNHSHRLWALVVLALWLRAHFSD